MTFALDFCEVLFKIPARFPLLLVLEHWWGLPFPIWAQHLEQNARVLAGGDCTEVGAGPLLLVCFLANEWYSPPLFLAISQILHSQFSPSEFLVLGAGGARLE